MSRRKDRQAFVTGYTFAMLWANTMTEDGEIPCQSVATLRRLCAPGVLPELARDARNFLDTEWLDDGQTVEELVRETIAAHPHYSWGQAGHDYALTRNRHGAGFWDRGIGEYGRTLTDVAHAMYDSTLTLAADGRVHLS